MLLRLLIVSLTQISVWDFYFLTVIYETLKGFRVSILSWLRMKLSIAQGVVLDQIKIARVVPLFKADDQSLFTNYRPVSVLPSFSKFPERIIYNRLYDYLTNLHILCDNQLGFRKNHSTTLALIDLHEKISSAIDRCELAVGVFFRSLESFRYSQSFHLIW